MQTKNTVGNSTNFFHAIYTTNGAINQTPNNYAVAAYAPQSIVPMAATPQFLQVEELEARIEQYLTEFDSGGASQSASHRTTEKKRSNLRVFRMFIESHEFRVCDGPTLKAYFAHLNKGYVPKQGNSKILKAVKPYRPSTRLTFYYDLVAFFNFLVSEQVIRETPMRSVKKPTVPQDAIPAFSVEQVRLLLEAAKKSAFPQRNVAIVGLLADSGIRVSELTGILVGDIDFKEGSIQVTGKGNKTRTVYVNEGVLEAIQEHLNSVKADGISDSSFVFLAQSGPGKGRPITRNGIDQMLKKLGRAAGLKNVRVSAHTFRHFFGITSHRNGCDVYSLQQLLGHTSYKQTRIYVSIAQADIKQAHAKSSPLASVIAQ